MTPDPVAPPSTTTPRRDGEAWFVDAVLHAMLEADQNTSVIIFDRDLRYRAVDGRPLERHGYRAEDVIGKTLHDVIPESAQPALESAYRAAIDGKTVVLERETDDRGAIFETTFSPLRAGDQIIGGIAIAVDVTARRQEQALLADAERMFEQAFVASPIGMAIVAPDGRWLKVNPAVCDMLDRTEDVLLDGAFQDVTHPDDLDADILLVQETLDGLRDGYEMDKRYLTAAGHTVWARLVVSLIRNADGTPRWFVSQMMDITARRQLDQQLRHPSRRTTLDGR